MNVAPVRRRCWIALLLSLVLLGCATVREATAQPIQLWQIAREVPNASPRWQRAAPDKTVVRVWRNGREIGVERQMGLQPGDEVETGANAAVVIRYRDSGDMVVLQRTRVKVGSLEVFFGRVFALLRNKFTVSSQTVVAGVEGTRFLFEVAPDRAVRVAVADGVVVCTSPKGAWSPVRLRANEALVSRYPSRASPTVGVAEASELRAYQALSEQVSRATDVQRK